MNLTKLFEMQAKLDKHIYTEHPLQEGEDRLSKKILALQVELAECAQESRCFKYWSNDQKPRRVIEYAICKRCNGLGFLEDEGDAPCPVKNCLNGELIKKPLLEEYVDCLHFILSIGLELHINTFIPYGKYIGPNIIAQYNFAFQDVADLSKAINEDWSEEDRLNCFYELVNGFVGLGEMLGFTWEEVEQAYFEKNKTNHQRQEEGY